MSKQSQIDHLKKLKNAMDIPISHISQEDIKNRKPFDQIDQMPNRDVFNDSTLMSITPPGPQNMHFGGQSPNKTNMTHGTFDKFPNTAQQLSEASIPTPV